MKEYLIKSWNECKVLNIIAIILIILGLCGIIKICTLIYRSPNYNNPDHWPKFSEVIISQSADTTYILSNGSTLIIEKIE